jgi:hypothetical protein
MISKIRKKKIINKLCLDVCRSLFHKSNPDHDAEEVVILSLSDVYAEQPSVTPAIPCMLTILFCI